MNDEDLIYRLCVGHVSYSKTDFKESVGISFPTPGSGSLITDPFYMAERSGGFLIDPLIKGTVADSIKVVATITDGYENSGGFLIDPLIKGTVSLSLKELSTLEDSILSNSGGYLIEPLIKGFVITP